MMETEKKARRTSISMRHRQLDRRIIQNFHLVWLDENIDEINNDDCRNFLIKLQEIVNTVNTFNDVDECIDFIHNIEKHQALMIVSAEMYNYIRPIVQDISQISSVYIFSEKNMPEEKLVQQLTKIKGVYQDITSICAALEKAVWNFDHNSISVSFVKDTSNQSLDTIHSSFMYTQILKEILLTMNSEQLHINDFLVYCRERFVGNIVQQKTIDRIEREYHCHQPIWWYTYESFLYRTLNYALRVMDIQLIIKFGFFLQDLHNHIAALHSEQYTGQDHSNSFIVYRGQGMSQEEFDPWTKMQGGLMSFNNFLSTSRDRIVSRVYAETNLNNPNMNGVLFQITIDPSISTTPFANIKEFSQFQDEEEILFSMHSVFRIEQVKQVDGIDRLWQIDLTLTSDHDPQLQALTKSMQEETQGSTGWSRIAKLMMKLGQFNKVEELYHVLLEQTTDEREKVHLLSQLGSTKHHQGKYEEAITFYEKAREIVQKNPPALASTYNNIGAVYYSMGQHSKTLSYYKKALEIQENVLSAYHPELASSYNNIGGLYHNMGEYSEALKYFEKALEIREKTLPPNHPVLAIFYNNIGMVYNNIGKYSKTLEYYEKALEIRQKILPATHPDLATSYSNVGAVYYHKGEYSKALEYFEKAFEIEQKTLPVNHPDLATSYNNVGGVYENMGEYSKALEYFEKALEIQEKSLPVNHPDLATSYNNMGSVYNGMAENSKALEYYEQALEIRRKTLLTNHPDLASSYNNIGGVYDDMGEYSKALEYYQKALEIFQTLPANHPSLATAYNNIGRVYCNMGDYVKALEYYERALEIRSKTLPVNHPALANSYNNIGGVYNTTSKYSKALEYHEKALEIRQKTLPENHSDLAQSYNNIGGVYDEMREFSKALEYFEKSLEIRQKTLPANHRDLVGSYKNIGGVYTEMGEYSKALPYQEKILEIQQNTLSANHPSLVTSYRKIGKVYYKMGEYSKTLSYLERALDILQNSLDPNHPDIEKVKQNITIVKKKL